MDVEGPIETVFESKIIFQHFPVLSHMCTVAHVELVGSRQKGYKIVTFEAEESGDGGRDALNEFFMFGIHSLCIVVDQDNPPRRKGAGGHIDIAQRAVEGVAAINREHARAWQSLGGYASGCEVQGGTLEKCHIVARPSCRWR